MYTGYYRFADKIIEIISIYKDVQDYCASYAALCEDGRCDYHVKITQEDIDREPRIEEGTLPDSEYEKTAVYRKIVECLLADDILLMHGSCIAVDGRAYIFTARSGTGKSTHTRLWREIFKERAVMVNDDKPLLKVTESGITVYGTPYDGKHRLSTNIAMPLAAICVLERGEENSIERITAKDIYPVMMQQIYRPKEASELMKTMDLIDKLIAKVSLYRLHCNMDPSAAKLSYETMSGDKLEAKKSIKSYLEETGRITYANKGVSMMPLLKEGRDLFTVERKEGRLKKYDVVLYMRPNGQYVLHRVVKVRKHDYVILGDNCVSKEYGITDDMILGVMTSYKRKGKNHTVDEALYKAYSRLVVALYPVRRVIRRIGL